MTADFAPTGAAIEWGTPEWKALPPTDPRWQAAIDRKRAAEHEAAVHGELVTMRARRDARRRLEEEEAASELELPPSTYTLTEELAIPDEPISFTIDELLPRGGNALLAAVFKGGKTTMVANLARSLADAEPFLGKFGVRPLTGRVALLNYEVERGQMRRWLRDIGIFNTDRVSVLNLRGYRLPITSRAGEDALVRWLADREVEAVIVDPYARASVGQAAENANDEAGIWLDALDVIKRRAGVVDGWLVHHMGRATHNEGDEHGRGATRLDDWADVRWLLVKDENGQRYFRATGRDVDTPEMALAYDPDSRHLTVAGGSRKDKRTDVVVELVVDLVTASPGIGANGIEKGIGEPKHIVRAARERALRQGLIHVIQEANRKQAHHPGPGAPGAP